MAPERVPDRARTPGRRRTTALVAAGVVTVVVAIGAVVTLGPTRGDTAGGEPAAYGLDRGCPPADTPIPYPDDGVLPRGAVSVRLCNAPGDLSYTGRDQQRVEDDFQAPTDALTADVDSLLDVVDGLAKPVDTSCAGVGGSTHVYWFTYPDGTASAVSWLFGACADVTVGPGEMRTGGSDLHAAFATGLQEQRADRTPPGETSTPACGPLVQPTSQVVPGDTLDLASAVVCRTTQGRQAVVRQAVLDPTQLAALSKDYTVSTEPLLAQRECRDDIVRIVGYTSWGDLVQLIGLCGDFTVPEVPRYPALDADTVRTWHASDEVDAMIAGLPYGSPEPVTTYPPRAFSTSTAPANG